MIKNEHEDKTEVPVSAHALGRISFHFQTRKCTNSMLHWGAISEEKSLFSHCAGPRHSLMEFRKDDTRLKTQVLRWSSHEMINIGSRTSQFETKNHSCKMCSQPCSRHLRERSPWWEPLLSHSQSCTNLDSSERG